MTHWRSWWAMAIGLIIGHGFGSHTQWMVALGFALLVVVAGVDWMQERALRRIDKGVRDLHG